MTHFSDELEFATCLEKIFLNVPAPLSMLMYHSRLAQFYSVLG